MHPPRLFEPLLAGDAAKSGASLDLSAFGPISKRIDSIAAAIAECLADRNERRVLRQFGRTRRQLDASKNPRL